MWGDVGRGRCGEMWGGEWRCGEVLGEVGRRGEVWGEGGVGRCGEMWGADQCVGEGPLRAGGQGGLEGRADFFIVGSKQTMPPANAPAVRDERIRKIKAFGIEFLFMRASA